MFYNLNVFYCQARNIACCVEFRDSDNDSAAPLKVCWMAHWGVVINTLSGCCYLYTEWLLLFTHWVIVVIYTLSDCCYLYIEWWLLFTHWVIIIIYTMLFDYFHSTQVNFILLSSYCSFWKIDDLLLVFLYITDVNVKKNKRNILPY